MSPSLKRTVLIQLVFPFVLLILGILQGLLQVLFRAGIIRADSFLGLNYYQGLTAHGVINAIVLTTFFACAFGNTIVALELKKISEKIANLGLALLLLGSLCVAGAILAGQGSVLYTFYPPLKAHPIFYIGLVLFVVGSWVSFWNWIPSYLSWRKQNPGRKTPLAVVGIFTTFIVWQFCTLPVAYEVIILLLPWSLGWVEGVNVVLARTLFWFFGHALVYFWLLPTYVMFYSYLPRISGGKLYSDFAARFAFMLFIVLSTPIGLHHQFADPGIATVWKGLHAVLTSIIAIPSLLTAFTVAASLEFAARSRGGQGLFAWWKKLPYWNAEAWLFPYLFCGLLIFIFGGATGIVNASFNVNMVVHNTSWIPAHFHLTVGGPVFLGILGMGLYLVLGILKYQLNNVRAALSVPYLWTLGVFIFSSGLFIGGLRGEPRRSNLGLTYLDPSSPEFRPDWVISTTLGVVGGIVMSVAVLLFFYVLFGSLMAKKSSGQELSLPTSEALHDEEIPAVQNFRPWVIAGIVAIVLSYGPPLYQIYQGQTPPVPGFKPESPVPSK